MNLKSNLFYLLLDKIFVLFITLILSIFTYRVLGAEKVGILNTAQSLWALFGFLISFGLDTILVKFLIRYKKKSKYILSSAFFIKLVGSIFAISLCLISANLFFSSDDSLKITILIISFSGFLTPFSVVDLYLQSIHKAKTGAKARLIAKLASSCIHVVFLFNFIEVFYYAALMVIYNLVLVVFYAMILKGLELSFKHLVMFYNKKIARLLVSRSSSLLLASIAVPLFLNSDVVMITYFLGAEEAGYYSAATKLILPLSLVSTSIVIAFFPLLVAISDKENLLNEKLIELSSFMFWFAFFISILLFSYSEEIIEMLYGGGFGPSTNIFNVQIFTVPLAFLGPVGTRWLIIKGYVDVELYKTLAAAILNVALNYLFIREFGAIAATYTSLLSYLVANILFFVVFSKTRVFIRVLFRSLNIKNAYFFVGYIIKKVK